MLTLRSSRRSAPEDDGPAPLLDVLPPPLIFLFQALLVGAGQIQMPRDIVPHTRRTDLGLDVLLLFQKTTSVLSVSSIFTKNAGTFCKKAMVSLLSEGPSALFF